MGTAKSHRKSDMIFCGFFDMCINHQYPWICQTLDLQTEYAALMRLLDTLPEREGTILLSRAMENRSFAELADKYHMGYKGV